MNLSPLLDPIREIPGYHELLLRIRQDEDLPQSLRTPRAARPSIIAALADDVHRPILYIVPRDNRLFTLQEELPTWLPSAHVQLFPAPNALFYEQAAWGSRTCRNRIAALAFLTANGQPDIGPLEAENHCVIIVATARAIMTHTLTVSQFLQCSQWLREGDTIRLDRLLDKLLRIGYSPTSMVTAPGEYSRRGGILDLWPPADILPVRIEFFGNEIDSLRSFDPATQRSTDQLKAVRATPAREGLLYLYNEKWDYLLSKEEDINPKRRDSLLEFFLPWMNPNSTGLLNFLPSNSIVLLEDRTALEDTIGEIETQALLLRNEQVNAGVLPEDFPLPYLTLVEIEDSLTEHSAIDLGMMATATNNAISLSDDITPGPRFGGQLRRLTKMLTEWRVAHETSVIVSRQATRLSELWSDVDETQAVLETLPKQMTPGDIFFVQGTISDGWILHSEEHGKIRLLSDAEIFGWARPRPRARPRIKVASPETAYADLKIGDLVVHVDYGIGRFQGLVERTIGAINREFLMIEFAEGDQVYVPIHQADRISRYIGADARMPALSRLGGQQWERSKGKARQAIEEIAHDLLKLYVRRLTVQGHAFSPDTPWQHELEASFPYIETEDQLRALEEVKRDMQRNLPMDRLICGDVGYGKTEVALRAAFKSVMDGKQVAMLVPTTILAQQHFNTFCQRLAAFPVAVEMLSRFRSRREVKKILDQTKKGQIDILIGTHRLLQKDVAFKDLGLLIIDEEQRFGVTHKEHLKQMRTEVDILTLTATPIPRTLYMALTGARDISTINTPPEERLSVITHVGIYNPQLVRQAILRELERGGQVFFVHNRVHTIQGVRKRLQRLVPEARLSVAHGQMPEAELSNVMKQFTEGEVDVLISTSIIESGLDIPNANTLIVDRADSFGLAQLYQLRGRVGRGASRAYAYFFRRSKLYSTAEGLKRLEIIAENTQLGSGYSVAMHDLEMRGAGDILGIRQHGHISAIGFNLYTRLLTSAVQRLKTEYPLANVETASLPQIYEPLPVSIDLSIPCSIPSVYIQDRDLRIQLYRRMAELRSIEQIIALHTELSDRFGSPPPELENLIYQLKVKVKAFNAKVDAVNSKDHQILFVLSKRWKDHDLPKLDYDLHRQKYNLWFTFNPQVDWKEDLLIILTRLAEKLS
jgi:transcription-repair coupling factor (superfamily II helicase)